LYDIKQENYFFTSRAVDKIRIVLMIRRALIDEIIFAV